MFGIDGVKINLKADDVIDISNDNLSFEMAFSSKSDLVVDWVNVKVIERYKRGWGDSKLINEYILHDSTEEVDLLISEEETLVAPLTVHFKYDFSEIERIGKNPLLRPLVKTALAMKRVNSKIRIEVTAKVKGVKVNPMAVHHFSKIKRY